VVDESGKLTQDLLFDGETEIGYFPLEGRAYKNAMAAETYQDEQAVSLKLMLANLETAPRRTIDIDGTPVLSVYTKPIPFQEQLSDVNSALLSLAQPFIMDLQPVSIANRMDFDPSTKLPVGEGSVVVDESGQEHLVFYKKLAKKELFQTTSAKITASYTQDIPDQAFAESVDLSVHLQTIVGLDNIVQHVAYPIYALTEDDHSLHLVTSSLAVPNAENALPTNLKGILYASAIGPGINTVYANAENSITLSVIQGPTEEMKVALQQSTPDWVLAESKNLMLGDQPVNTWVMYPPDPTTLHLVIETEETLLYVDSSGLTAESVAEILSRFARINQTQPARKIILQ